MLPCNLAVWDKAATTATLFRASSAAIPSTTIGLSLSLSLSERAAAGGQRQSVGVTDW